MSGNDDITETETDAIETLEDLEDVGDDRAELLRTAGYGAIDDLRGASEVELQNLRGIGKSVARTIKRQVGSRNPEDATRTVYTTELTPEEWTVTPREAAYLEELSGYDSEELVDTPASDLVDRLENRIDPDLLGFRTVCGRVVKPDPQTGAHEPVPNATVHVEDTDCSFLGFFPPHSSLGWLFPTFCRTETIATVETNACGRFCVYVPRWEIDRILRYRLERVCLPELVKPSIRDLLEAEALLSEPRDVPKPRPVPRPRPDPSPPIVDGPGTFERLRELFDEDTARRLSGVGEELTFGDSTAATTELLSRPAFEGFEPPLPVDIRESGLPEAVEELGDFGNPHDLAEETTLTVATTAPESHLAAFDPDEYVGPFLRCEDAVVPEWVSLLDVPDITFRVTQDVDGDGHEETIYGEGFFDVRWDAHPVPDPTLVADGSARSIPTCDGPEIDEGECDAPELATAGLMSLRSAYHDDATGYALRPNRPWKSGFRGRGTQHNRPTSEAPYANTVQLHGCVRDDGAEHYRLLYSYRGHARQPFTGLEWTAPRLGAQPVDFKPDSDGWYDIRPKNDLVFPYWLLNWPTGAYPDGRYEIWVQTADGSKNVLEESSPVKFVVDNDDPDVDYRVEVSNTDTSSWTPLSRYAEENCPVIEREEGETVQLRVTYTASDDHFRDVKVDAIGCDVAPTRPSGVADREYEHWYTKPSDNSHSGQARFDIPSSHPDGTYTIRINANSRAFNPSGGRGGPGDDWKYDESYSWTHPRRRISVVTK